MNEQELREKVIKGLECCMIPGNGGCDDCPYVGKGICQALLGENALALLKSQEPVKPIPGLWDMDIQLYKCGACGGEIGAGGIAKYCFHCGQAVKWE